MVPHITDAIQEWIERVANVPVDGKEGPPDVCVIELGGTIGRYFLSVDIGQMSGFYLLMFCAGDIESMPFIEALGQFFYKVGKLCSEVVKDPLVLLRY